MSIFDQALHIPAEHFLFEPQRAQHERILLPLTARASFRFIGAVVLAVFAVSACLCMGVEMALSQGGGGGGLVFAACFVMAASIPAAIAAVGLGDVLRRGPQLVIDTEGVRDSRLSPNKIVWADVVSAEIVASASGINAVQLTLTHDGKPHFNPFRIGGWRADWRARRRVRTIALLLLDVRPHALAHAMIILAARNGAHVDPPRTAQGWPLA